MRKKVEELEAKVEVRDRLLVEVRYFDPIRTKEVNPEDASLFSLSLLLSLEFFWNLVFTSPSTTLIFLDSFYC